MSFTDRSGVERGRLRGSRGWTCLLEATLGLGRRCRTEKPYEHEKSDSAVIVELHKTLRMGKASPSPRERPLEPRGCLLQSDEHTPAGTASVLGAESKKRAPIER